MRVGDIVIAGSEWGRVRALVSDTGATVTSAGPSTPVEVLGFNGTTEWALDSVAVEDALWLPREDQLRDLLRGAFRCLDRTDDAYVVTAVIDGDERRYESVSAPEAYGLAVLALLDRVRA